MQKISTYYQYETSVRIMLWTTHNMNFTIGFYGLLSLNPYPDHPYPHVFPMGSYPYASIPYRDQACLPWGGGVGGVSETIYSS